MTRNKSEKKKEFLISIRGRTGASITNAPIWVLQKAKKRIYNIKGKRHWRRTAFGLEFKTAKRKSMKAKAKPKSGKHKKSARCKK